MPSWAEQRFEFMYLNALSWNLVILEFRKLKKDGPFVMTGLASTTEKTLIFSEALGCAPIAYPMLDSYFAHHKDPLTLFIYDDDAFENPNPELLTLVRVGDSTDWYPSKSELQDAYSRGHNGTALLWSRIMGSGLAERYIHLDADNIYLGNVVDDINQKLDLGFDVVGYRRPYGKAPNKLASWQRMLNFFATDTVHTFAMGLRMAASSNAEAKLGLEREIRGFHRFGKIGAIVPNLDFFDRVSKRLSPAASRTYFLGEGTRPRRHGFPSEPIFTERFLNFSAVGSGFSYMQHEPNNVPESYVSHAKRSFALYNSLFLGLPCEIDPLEAPDLIQRALKIDRQTWTVEK